MTLNGNAALYGTLIAPDSTVTLNGNATLVGTLGADQLTLNGGSAVQDIAAGRRSTPMRGPH